MMEAAWKIFLEKGFERATLSEIIALSGGSRSTLYEAFGGKDGLFEMVIVEKCETFLASLNLMARDGEPPEKTLFDFACGFVREIYTPESLRIMHIMLTEGERFPKVTEMFFHAGPSRVQQTVADYFRATTRAGSLTVRDPDLAADLFLSIIQGKCHFRRLLGNFTPPTPEELSHQVGVAVKTFLHGVSAA